MVRNGTGTTASRKIRPSRTPVLVSRARLRTRRMRGLLNRKLTIFMDGITSQANAVLAAKMTPSISEI
jgi:hypothetical protein